MAVVFYIGSDMEDAATNENCVEFSEELQTLLCRTSKLTSPKADLLLDLDPYGDMIFENEGIKEVIEACELIYEIYEESKVKEYAEVLRIECEEGEVKEFAKELKLLCEEAINKRFKLYALGD